VKREGVHRQSGGDQRSQDRGRPRDRDNVVAGLKRGSNEWEARIAQSGHARVRNQRDIARGEPVDQAADLRRAAELVKADQRRRDLVGVEQRPRHPGVLRRDHVDLTQDTDCPKRDVFQVPDRRADDVQRSHAVIMAAPVRDEAAPDAGAMRYHFDRVHV
jgi:hypothetical protein